MKFTLRTVALCALVALLLCGAAVAAVTSRVFDMSMQGLQPEYVTVQESAYGLVKADLGQIEGERFVIRAEEAIYDGQELRVVVSVTDKTGTLEVVKGTPETVADTGYVELTDAFWDALHADGFSMHDGLEMDGQYANPYETAQTAGEEPGQALFYTRCNPGMEGIVPEGEFAVKLAFWHLSEDRESPNREEKTITFTLDAAETEAYTRHAQAEPMIITEGVTLSLADGTFSPLLGSVRLRIEKEGETDCWKLAEDEAISAWLYDIKAVLPDGTQAPTMMEGYGPFSPDEPGVLQANFRIIPPAEWPETMTLLPETGEGLALRLE